MTGLARCVGDADHFLRDNWSRAPLHREGTDSAGFGDLFSLDDVDALISGSSLRLPQFRLVRGGAPVDPSRYTRSARLGGTTVSGVAEPASVFQEFADGATIVLQGLQRWWPPLTRYCRQLELELTHPVQANAYVTPPDSQGLAVHYDTHDVFVLQVAGHKEWLVYDPVLEDPLPSQPWAEGRGTPDEPGLAVDLQAGDSLYIPRGFLHAARARRGVSAHVTIGVLTTTWHDAMRELLDGLSEQVDFRRPLPVGFAWDEERLAAGITERLGLLRNWLDKVDAEAHAATMARRFWSNQGPNLTGQLHQLLALDELSDSSMVETRDGAVCRVQVDGERLTVLLGDRELVMPKELAPVIERISSAGRVRVGDLADQLDSSSRLVLIRRLVREGLLRAEPVG